MEGIRNLRILIAMQLRSVLDLSLLKKKRALILKVGLALVLFAAAVAGFYVAFYVCDLLSVFSFGNGIPDTVLTALFTVIEIMSIWSCMTGLSKALYRGADNVILLVLPVQQNIVFLSKLAVYYLSELKRSFTLTVPLFIAYGMVNGAVWFYYPWMLFCMLFVSLLPVALGAVLSIPALYIPRLVSRFRPVKYCVLVLAAAAFTALAFYLVGLIPENINLLGQWGSITLSVRNFLDSFARWFAPFHYLNRMMIGGSLEITRSPFSAAGGIAFAANLAAIAALLLVAFFTARLLFLKMTAKAGESELRTGKAKKNRVRPKWWSPVSEDVLRSVRSGKAVWRTFVEFFVPAFLIFALNKMYAAMNTSLSGQTMTAAFNILVLLVTVLSSNTFLAHVYSRDGAARNLIKTRPADFRLLLSARLVTRTFVSTVSIVVAVLLYRSVASLETARTVWLCCLALFLNFGHILWSAEMDVMNPEDRSASGNSARSTVAAIVISVLFAGAFYLLAGSGASAALRHLAIAAFAFFAVRAYLYFERIRVYFIEK